MPEWWLIDGDAQQGIAKHIDLAAQRVVKHFDRHANENSLTAAFGQELIREPLRLRKGTVHFGYRNFSEQSEEPATGADGAFVIAIETPDETVRKGVLFQAKRLEGKRPVRSLRIDRGEANRLARQAEGMLEITKHSLVLAHTRKKIYAVDAQAVDDVVIDDVRRFPEFVRLVSIGTYLGRWVARCTSGEVDPRLVAKMERPFGFVRHLITVDIKTTHRPMLTEGGITVDARNFERDVPTPRWRKR